MDQYSRFLERYHLDEVEASDIGPEIVRWHHDPHPAVSLHVHLGMTLAEYRAWLMTRRLPTIAAHHRVPLPPDEHAGHDGPLLVHHPVGCRAPCSVHWPSEHALMRAPLRRDEATGVFMRVCQHGRNHPDPDDVQVRTGDVDGLHDCDGCCRPSSPLTCRSTT